MASARLDADARPQQRPKSVVTPQIRPHDADTGHFKGRLRGDRTGRTQATRRRKSLQRKTLNLDTTSKHRYMHVSRIVPSQTLSAASNGS